MPRDRRRGASGRSGCPKEDVAGRSDRVGGGADRHGDADRAATTRRYNALCGGDVGHAMSSIASQGAAATAAGVSPVNALTSRLR